MTKREGAPMFVAVLDELEERERIRGGSFREVADQLVQRGYDMARATEHTEKFANTLRVPHTNGGGAALLIAPAQAKKAESPTPPKPTQIVFTTAKPPEPGLRTRECGAVHPEGGVCSINVLYEQLPCGCGDRCYGHDGPHEAMTDQGIRYRWEAVLVVRDLPYNTYGPMSDDEMNEFKEK